MNLPLPRYREVKDRYCVCYFGPCDEYITLLIGLRDQAQQALPGLQMYVGCRDPLYGVENTVPESVVRQMVREPWSTGFGHIREIRCNLEDHPVEQFFKESEINLKPASAHKPDASNRVVQVYPSATSPTRSLTNEQIEAIRNDYQKKGYVVRIGGNWQEAGIVVGVESVPFWEAVLAGKTAVLCDTGLGRALFSVICPWGGVISR